ncbi:hypothetical protein Dimus_028561, partial [Dionaea muscipula]
MERIRDGLHSCSKDHAAVMASARRPGRGDDVDSGINARVDTLGGGGCSASFNHEDCLGPPGLRMSGEIPKQRDDIGMEGFEAVHTIEVLGEVSSEMLGKGESGGRQSQNVSKVENSFSLVENGVKAMNRRRMVEGDIIIGEYGGTFCGQLIGTNGIISDLNFSYPGSNMGDQCENLGQSSLLGGLGHSGLLCEEAQKATDDIERSSSVDSRSATFSANHDICPVLSSELPPCGVTTRQMREILGAKPSKGVSIARRKFLSRSAASNLVVSNIGLSSSTQSVCKEVFREAEICWKIGKDLGLVSNMDDDKDHFKASFKEHWPFRPCFATAMGPVLSASVSHELQ